MNSTLSGSINKSWSVVSGGVATGYSIRPLRGRRHRIRNAFPDLSGKRKMHIAYLAVALILAGFIR